MFPEHRRTDTTEELGGEHNEGVVVLFVVINSVLL